MNTHFHLAYHVHDLDESRIFYSKLLGCREGRSTKTWVDFDFFGHQLSLHLGEPFTVSNTGIVGEHKVPMPHFGLILPLDEWKQLAEHLSNHRINFIIPPSVRFKGESGEQAIMFF